MARLVRSLTVADARLPMALLAATCLISLGARVAWLGAPCHAPCRSANDRVLIFDERYYVNAARVIAGIHPPPAAPYADAPLGHDPNAEHPQLGKLVIAGLIELLGDGPWAWRLGSLIAGTLAILGMFALVRAAGGGRWSAVAAAALMAADNLMIVHGRIGTLDIYALAPVLWGVTLYLRQRPWLGGLLIGIGISAKLVAAFVLVALAMFELLRLRGDARARPAGLRLGACGATATAVFFGLLALFGRIAPPYDATARAHVAGGALGHLAHMLRYGAGQSSPHGPQGIASYPWGWLVDYKPIVYLNINPSRPAPGLYHVHPAVHFLGLISPPILLLALPALALAGARIARERVGPDLELAQISVAWFAGTFLPFVLLSLALKRTSYLYYMLIVMPGLYAAAAWLLWAGRRRPRLALLWAIAVVVAAVVAYPLTPLP
jgi:predicted membrane-bound dolichyl-phosphate-mannose-protein mannosyltransferase